MQQYCHAVLTAGVPATGSDVSDDIKTQSTELSGLF